jgi:hypothetical protein
MWIALSSTGAFRKHFCLCISSHLSTGSTIQLRAPMVGECRVSSLMHVSIDRYLREVYFSPSILPVEICIGVDGWIEGEKVGHRLFFKYFILSYGCDVCYFSVQHMVLLCNGCSSVMFVLYVLYLISCMDHGYICLELSSACGDVYTSLILLI